MKEGWEIKKLGDVCVFKSGTTISTSLEREIGDVLYVKVGDMNLPENEIEINTSSRFVNSNEIKAIQIIPEGAVIFPKRGGAIATNKKRKVIRPTIVDLNTMAIIPANKLDNEYFYYWFQMIDLNDISNGTTIPQINNYSFDNVHIAYPNSLPEQQRIVSILDEAFAAIAKAKTNAEQNLKNAKELFESYLQGVFEKKGDGWEERKVNEIGNAQTGTTPKTAEKENYGDFIPFVKPADVDFSGIGDIRYDNEGLSEIGLKKGRKMESGSILMVCIGATIGKVGIAEREVSCNQQINSLTVKKEFEPKFIYYAMTSKAFQEKVLLEGKGAQATLPIINKSKWENLTISFPKSKTEQKLFVEKFDALSTESQKLQEIYLNKIADLEELKKSILQKAFAGELKTEKAVAL